MRMRIWILVSSVKFIVVTSNTKFGLKGKFKYNSLHIIHK